MSDRAYPRLQCRPLVHRACYHSVRSAGRSAKRRRSAARANPVSAELLTAFWIVPPGRHGPLGFGVTAYDIDDALSIIRSLGYATYLPTDLSSLEITRGVRYTDLEENHVRTNMGPIVVRGMWYPFVRIGL